MTRVAIILTIFVMIYGACGGGFNKGYTFVARNEKQAALLYNIVRNCKDTLPANEYLQLVEDLGGQYYKQAIDTTGK